jgi:uncharacterized repeat protein (TIGR01451 family)
VEGEGTINYWLTDGGELGALEINKVVTGDSGDDTDFTITITGPDGFTHQDTISQGTSLSFPGLAVGGYTITESVPVGYLPVDAVTSSVISGETATVTIYNEKDIPEPDPSTITINKEILDWPDFGGDIPSWWVSPPTAFNVSYTGPDTTGSVIITEAAPVVLSDMTTGAYIFTEAFSPYYTTSPATINVTLDEGGSESITFTNRLDRYEFTGVKSITGEAIAVSTDLSGYEFYVDYDGDGQHDAMEPGATSDSSGNFTISGILPGTYEIREVANPGVYTLVYPATGSHVVTFPSDAQVEEYRFINELNVDGAITLYKNLTGYPEWEGPAPDWWLFDEPGFTVNYSGPTTGSVIISETTPAVITDLAEGTYTFTEADNPLYTTSQASFTLTFEPGDIRSLTFENSLERYGLAGTKYEDEEGYFNDTSSLVLPTGPVLEGWVFYVDYNDNGLLDPGEPNDTSGSDGNYGIENILPGTYKVREVSKPGWIATYPGEGYYELDFGEEEIFFYPFYNYYDENLPETWDIQGYVFYDEDTDNDYDTEDIPVEGVTMDLFLGVDEDDYNAIILPNYATYPKDGTTVTDADGYYRFTGIPTTTTQALVVRSSSVEGPVVSEYDGTLTGTNEVDYVYGQYDDPYVNFGHWDHHLQIEKSVDDSSVEPGDTVTYTVIVRNLGNMPFYSLNVTDELEDEDPVVLGTDDTFEPGETHTYTYTTSFSSEGTYDNIARALGYFWDETPMNVSDDATVVVSEDDDPPPRTTRYTLSGYLFSDLDGDNVVDAGETGYEDVTVELYQGDSLYRTTTTNADGRYSFSDLRGTYTVVANPEDEILDAQISEADGTLDQEVTESVYATTSNVNFGYLPAPLDVTTLISGFVFNDLDSDNVMDAGETGYSNVEVTLWYDGEAVTTTITAANGLYVFDFLTNPELNGMDPGDYTVTIGTAPTGVYQVSEYDGTPMDSTVVLTLTEETEAITDVNFGFKSSVTPSGETYYYQWTLLGCLILLAGAFLRKKPSF